MKLSEYLEKESKSYWEFARDLKIDPGAISNYFHGKRPLQYRTYAKIEHFTLGKVTHLEMLEDWVYRTKTN